MPLEDHELLNLSHLEELQASTFGNEPEANEGMRMLLSIFIRSAKALLVQLDAALSAGKVEEAAKVSHTLKGSSGNAGAQAFYLVARTLNDSLKSAQAVTPEHLAQAAELSALLPETVAAWGRKFGPLPE